MEGSQKLTEEERAAIYVQESVARDDDADSDLDEEEDDNNDRAKKKGVVTRMSERFQRIDWTEVALKTGSAILSLFRKNRTQVLLERFADHEGRLEAAFHDLQITWKEKVYICEMWLQIDEDQNNKMSYLEFCDFFNIDTDEYASRLFLIMNSSLTGVVNLAEFVEFCSLYLVVDKWWTTEFAFRMLSRRAAAERTHHTVLGMDDIKYYCKVRYQTQTSKFAYNLYTYMDADGDGGLDFQEWREFCDDSNAIVAFFHKFLMHLRKCVFSLDFWVQRTRMLKKKYATGLKRLVRTSKINKTDEKYCEELGDPIVDKWGKTVKHDVYNLLPGETADIFGNVDAVDHHAETKEKREKTQRILEEMMGTAVEQIQDEGKAEGDADDNRKLGAGGQGKENSRENKMKEQKAKEEFEEMEDDDSDDDMDDKPIDPKSTLGYKGRFGTLRLPQTSKSKDFPEVAEKRAEEKALKEKKAKKTGKLADKFAGRAYDLMVNTIRDLLHGLRPVRMGFERWLEVVGMESTLPKKVYTQKKRTGTLTVTIEKGSEIKYAIGSFGKKTCIVEVKVGNREALVTDPAQNAGKFPIWKERMELTTSSDDKDVVFNVKDENDVGTQKTMGEARQDLHEWTSKFPGPKLERTLQLFAVGSDSIGAKRKPLGELHITVKYAEKGGGDELQNRLGANAGLGAAVDRMMEEEPESDEEDLLGEKPKKESEKNGTGGMFGGLFGKKEEEKKEKEKTDNFAVHKKIVDTTTRMVADREFSTYEDYRKEYLMHQTEKIDPHFDRTTTIKKLLEAKAIADDTKELEEEEVRQCLEEGIERPTRLSFAEEQEEYSRRISFDIDSNKNDLLEVTSSNNNSLS